MKRNYFISFEYFNEHVHKFCAQAILIDLNGSDISDVCMEIIKETSPGIDLDSDSIRLRLLALNNLEF